MTFLKLLYVDGTKCIGLNDKRTVHPLEFWTFENLKLREEMEIENGGFGLGEFQNLFVDNAIKDCERSEGDFEEGDNTTLEV